MDNQLCKEFIWQVSANHGGESIPVSQMKTKHLFYTWLMIWNHSAPKELRIWDTHRYTFGSFYTPKYMLNAFRSLYIELKNRDDIGYKMLGVIESIENNYRKTCYIDSNIKRIENNDNPNHRR